MIGRSVPAWFAVLLLSTALLPALSSQEGGAVPCPTRWHGSPQNPVLGPGPAGGWDSAGVMTHCVLWDGTQFRLYYQGSNGSASGVGLATSLDGVNWTKHPANPVLSAGAAASWESSDVGAPWVLLEGSGYRMWYCGRDGARWRIGHATSSDGIAWARHASNPVLDLGPAGSWDGDHLLHPCVLRSGGGFRMWYAGLEGAVQRIGLAESSDGLGWSRHPADPLLEVGAEGDWDGSSVGGPCVLNVSGEYRMWYSGGNGRSWAIGYANSSDGVSWRTHPRNPVLSRQGTGWESRDCLLPAVLFNGTGYRMWYTGMDAAAVTRAGTADGWNAVPGPPVLLSPENATWSNRSTPSFKWIFQDEDSDDAQGAFEILIDDDPAFGSVDRSTGMVASSETAHVLAAPIPDGDYSWKVRTWDRELDAGGWSQPSGLRVDATPPENPVGLASPSHETGAWSSDPTVDATWELPPGGETGSGYLGFSVLWDQDPAGLPDTVIELPPDATSVTSPPFIDTSAAYFHVKACDRAGNWASAAAHLGPFLIDASLPRMPVNLSSTSHSIGEWSPDNTVDVAWTAADAEISGVDGYSALWDRWQSSLPPPILNIGPQNTSTTSPPLDDGSDWYFHLRPKDRAGNWAGTAGHVGPFFIDTSPPETSALCLGTGFDASNTTDLQLAINASDPAPGSGIRDMRFSLDGAPWTEWEAFRSERLLSAPGPDGPRNVRMELRDGLGNAGPPVEAVFMVDRSNPSNVTLALNGGADCTNSPLLEATVRAADSPPSAGLGSLSFSQDGRTWSAWRPFGERVNLTLGPGDGEKRIRVLVRDAAGNVGPEAVDGIFLDTAAPDLTRAIDESQTGRWNDLTVPVSLKVNDPIPSSGWDEVCFSEDNVTWTGWQRYSDGARFTLSKGDGNRVFWCRVRDMARNPSEPAPVRIFMDTTPPLVHASWVTAVSSTVAVVNWRTDEPADSLVEYGLTASYGSSRSSPGFVTEHGLALTDLQPGTEYHARVVANDLLASGPVRGRDLVFRTLRQADRDPPVLFRVRVDAVSSVSALICWETDEPSDGLVEYGRTEPLGSSKGDARYLFSHAFLLTGLAPGATYRFRVASTDAVGNPACKSDLLSFTTPPSPVPSYPRCIDVRVSGISSTLAVVTWRTDEPALGTVEFGPSPEYTRSATTAVLSRSHSVVLTGLEPSTTHHFRVGAVDIHGGGPNPTKDLTFDTTAEEDDWPPTIQHFIVLTAGTDHATLEVVLDEPGTVAVSFGPDASRGRTAGSPSFLREHSVTICGLAPGRKYHYSLTVEDPSGNNLTTGMDLTFRTKALPLGTGESPSIRWVAALALGAGIALVLGLALVRALFRLPSRKASASPGAEPEASPSEEEAMGTPPPSGEVVPAGGGEPSAPVQAPPPPAGEEEIPVVFALPVEDAPLAPSGKMKVLERVSLDDLGPAGNDRAGTAGESPGPKEREVALPAEEKFLRAMTSLPRGIPSELSAMGLDALASALARADRRRTASGADIVRIGNRWYHGNPDDVSTYLQRYGGE